VIEYFYDRETKIYNGSSEANIDPISDLPILSSNGTLKKPSGSNILWSTSENNWIDGLSVLKLTVSNEVRSSINATRRKITGSASYEQLSGWNLKALMVSHKQDDGNEHLITEVKLRNMSETETELRNKISYKFESMLQAISVLDGIEYSYLSQVEKSGSVKSIYALYEDMLTKLKQSF